MSLPDFQTLLQWAGEHPGWLVAAGFALAFIEALAVVGVVVPGILLLFLLGALVGWDVPLLIALALSSALGAMAGDGLSYWLGRGAGAGLSSRWPFRGHPQWLAYGHAFFAQHGGKSVFIARFIGPLRPIVPLVAGSMQMPPSSFLPRMLLACLVWAPLMLAPGVVFGESLALAAEFGGRLTLLLLVVIVGLATLTWLVRLVYEFGARRNRWWMKNLALWLRRHPRFGRMLGPLMEPGGREVLTVVLLGLVLVASVAALFTALVIAPFLADALDAGFRFSGLAASLRSHLADPLFISIALAVSPPVLLALIAWLALLLVVQKQRVALVHWLLATLGGLLLAMLLDWISDVLLTGPEIPSAARSIPDTGFALAVLVFGFAALMLTRDLRPRRRKWLVLATTLVLALAGFTQFYFARTTLTGLTAGLALALGWLALTGIAYRVRARDLRYPGLTVALFFVGWLAGGASMIGVGYESMVERTRLELPVRTLPAPSWWDDAWQELPERRSRIGDADRQRFDLQLAGRQSVVRAALQARGWNVPPGAGRSMVRAVVAEHPDPDRLGHLPRDFAGQPEAWMLRKALEGDRQVLLRAWDSGVRLMPGSTPVWLVQVRTLEPVRRLGFFNTWKAVAPEDERAVLRFRDDLSGWRWQREDPGQPWRAWPGPSASQRAALPDQSTPVSSDSPVSSRRSSAPRRSVGSDTASSSCA